jgi:type II secretory pathway predicted ATPase ExeA
MLQPRGSNDLTVQSGYGGLESYNLETGEVTYLKTIDGTYLLLLSYCKGTIDESRNVMQHFDFPRDPNRKVYNRFREIMSARFDRAMQHARITISDLQGPGHQLPQTQVTLQPPATP